MDGTGTNWLNGHGTRTGPRRGIRTSKVDMRDLLTFALMKVRHSVVQRPDIGEHVKADREKRKESREVGPAWQNNLDKKCRCAETARSPNDG